MNSSNLSSAIFAMAFLLTFNICSKNSVNYLDPRPDAKLVNTENSVTIGFDQPVNLTNKEIAGSIIIRNGQQNLSPGTIYSALNGTRIIIKPAGTFAAGTKITVTLTGKLRQYLPGAKDYTYSFQTASRKVFIDPQKFFEKETGSSSSSIDPSQLLLPPELIVSINNNPSPGNLYLAPWSGTTWLMLTNNSGSLLWSSQLLGFGGDFKKQPNGYMTYFKGADSTHYEINDNHDIVKSFSCGNGYTADIHELRVLLSGHAYLMAYDPEVVNMSEIVEGGDTAATVIGLIIQELDENGLVVFQWRSWDHFLITDATHENLLAHEIDYVHGNAIEIDNDSNLIISSRHLDEITKIDHSTGSIMWRMGGKNNQFTFIGDPTGFSHQHAIRRISNDDLLMYDNGNYHTPQFSRALEYKVNETAKTASFVWQYRHNPDVFGSWGGYAQRLPGGNTLIGWGGTFPTITEVTQSGEIVFEASFGPGVFTYRAYKFSDELTVTRKENETVPQGFNLRQNYPNPFNPSTTITFDISSAANAELKIRDITGREVQSMDLGYCKPGTYSVLIDGSDFASGLYFYTLKAGSFVSTRKMILLK